MARGPLFDPGMIHVDPRPIAADPPLAATPLANGLDGRPASVVLPLLRRHQVLGAVDQERVGLVVARETLVRSTRDGVGRPRPTLTEHPVACGGVVAQTEAEQ